MNMNRIVLSLIALILAITSFIFSLVVYVNKSSKNNGVTSEPVSQVEPVATSSEVMAISEPVVETEPKTEYIFYDVPFDLETQKAMKDICTEYDLEYELILGIISVESNFKPKVIGDGGNSFGLMQIQPKWWSKTMEREGVINLLDPLQNVRCGCAIVNELKDKYGTEYRALQAYNTGRPDSNNGYADRVYRDIGELKIYGG